MNASDQKIPDPYRSYLLMEEIGREEPVSQRELSRRLDIALGLVNSYLKNLVAKGFVRIKAFPRNRYAYVLTPQGLAEKSRLAYQHLSYFTNLYRIARQDYAALFRKLAESGITKVSFCGVDEVAEIAYLSLRETAIELSVVMDDDRAGESFFGMTVCPLRQGVERGGGTIVITSLKQRGNLAERLAELGVPETAVQCPGWHGFESGASDRSGHDPGWMQDLHPAERGI